MTKPTKWPVHPTKTHIHVSLGRCPGWSESSLGTQIILFVVQFRPIPTIRVYDTNEYENSETCRNESHLVLESFYNRQLKCKISEKKWAASWQNPQNGMCSQRRLIRPVWSESSLFAWRKLGPYIPTERKEKTDQTGRMSRLTWVFAGRTVILLVLSWGGSLIKLCLLYVHVLGVTANKGQKSRPFEMVPCILRHWYYQCWCLAHAMFRTWQLKSKFAMFQRYHALVWNILALHVENPGIITETYSIFCLYLYQVLCQLCFPYC